MCKTSSINLEYHFLKIISHILKNYNFTTMPSKNNCYYDILAKINNTNYIIELKYSRTNQISSSLLLDVAYRLKKIVASNNQDIPVLVINTQLSSQIRQKIENIGVIIIDLQNLLFLVKDNELLKCELLSILDFSINDLLPIKPNLEIFNEQKNNPKEKSIYPSKNQGELLKKRIYDWKPSKGHIKYEDLCFEILKYLFNDELSLWYRQQTSNKELYRFDLICKIKDGNINGFWNTILQFFNSKYIIFEFKNYTKKITQKEIYTTDKYLYLKALRSVAIIISCNGASTNANKAIKGTLRENGKLILSINNQDLITMIDMKISNAFPSDHLYSIFDKLLINLEK